MLRRRLLFVAVVPLLLQPAVAASDWKAGAAKISITPHQSLMARPAASAREFENNTLRHLCPVQTPYNHSVRRRV